MPALSRRRVLSVTGAAAGMALMPGATAAAPRWTWRGTALGARAEITLVHPSEAEARRLIRLAVDEIERLENVFSLYRNASELARLNRDGVIDAPSPDLRALLSTARHFGELTAGAFDVTVQPLWQLYARHFSQPDADPRGPSETAIAVTLARVDHRAIELTPARIRFARPGMAITLNGIAQGYITDRVVELLRARGIDRTLVDLGEIRALGRRPDGRAWRVAIDGREPRRVVDLIDRAIATSSPSGTVFDPAARVHHLFDPATGRPSAAARQVSVIAASAATADALSTAFAIMPAKERTMLERRIGPGIEVVTTG